MKIENTAFQYRICMPILAPLTISLKQRLCEGSSEHLGGLGLVMLHRMREVALSKVCCFVERLSSPF